MTECALLREASEGIGTAFSKRLSEYGWQPLSTARHKEPLANRSSLIDSSS